MQEAEMKAEAADRKALRVARELHLAEQPEVTILFGSRARGDYREGRSDIDIMLVQDRKPSDQQKARAQNQAQRKADQLYPAHTPVQIVWQTSEEFDRMRRTINHVVANALREGITMPRNSEEYSHRFEEEYDEEENEWIITDERRGSAENYTRSFNALVETGMDDDSIGLLAHKAMEHALKSLISAKGVNYPQTHDVNELAFRALRADRELEFEPAIGSDVYNQYTGREEYQRTSNPISSIPDYQKLVNHDVRTILDRVDRLRSSRQDRPPRWLNRP